MNYRRHFSVFSIFAGAVQAIELLLDVSADIEVLGKDRNGKGVLHKAVHYLQETFEVEEAAAKYSVDTIFSAEGCT